MREMLGIMECGESGWECGEYNWNREKQKESVQNPTLFFAKIKKKDLLRNKAKINYYSKLLHNYKADYKWTWEVMKGITGKQKTKLNLLF